MTQPCGHDESHVTLNERGDGTTYCSACLPDGSLTTYVQENVGIWCRAHGMYVSASIAPLTGGKIAMTPHATEDEAHTHAGSLNNEAWVVSPEGEVLWHHPGAVNA